MYFEYINGRGEDCVHFILSIFFSLDVEYVVVHPPGYAEPKVIQRHLGKVVSF